MHNFLIYCSNVFRELYYSEPELTQSQQKVDTTIKDICCILEASPWELGVFSSSKGLLAGNIRITLPDDDIVDCNSIAGGKAYFWKFTIYTLIIPKLGIIFPHLTTGIKRIETNAKFVLLVEKDTVFEKLIQHDILQRFNGNCIMITVSSKKSVQLFFLFFLIKISFLGSRLSRH